MRIAEDRGYTTVRAIADALKDSFGISRRRVIMKITEGHLTKEQCEVIGSFFEMTPKEYYECFMHGFFRQTKNGKFVCEVDDPAYHIMFSNRDPIAAKKNMERKLQKQKLLEELEQLQSSDTDSDV